MAKTTAKQSYTISCSSAFRDQVLALARRRNVNAADLARSVVLVVPPALLAAFPDPGEPAKGDREVVIVKSGPAKGRPWHRKPRLQVRFAPGTPIPALRRALGLALAMDRKEIGISLAGLEDAESAARGAREAWTPDKKDRRETKTQDDEELTRLRAIVSVLAFEPLPGGVKTEAEALHVLGIAPGRGPGIGERRARFRMLAAIHHPDSGYGSHERMSQLNSAMDILGRGS
jgi:hypothetical protein